jgi:hypothetical protein
MGIKIKKIAKNKTVALFSLGGFVLAVAFRLLFGGSHLNISQLDSAAKDILEKTDLSTKSANADSAGGCGSLGGSSACGCGEGGEGSGGGGEGSGDGSGDGSGY